MSDNSGPAFPESYVGADAPYEGIGNGLTKRELFAAMAMQGMLSNSAQSHHDAQTIASLAVVMADALIAESQK